jgi:hypothetical protein
MKESERAYSFVLSRTPDESVILYLKILEVGRIMRINFLSGSNKYCLDVNYGGVLIIWDRIFGTFRPETDKVDIIYGLIYNQPSFNPVYLQVSFFSFVL